jgi:hypothetical protein
MHVMYMKHNTQTQEKIDEIAIKDIKSSVHVSLRKRTNIF